MYNKAWPPLNILVPTLLRPPTASFSRQWEENRTPVSKQSHPGLKTDSHHKAFNERLAPGKSLPVQALGANCPMRKIDFRGDPREAPSEIFAVTSRGWTSLCLSPSLSSLCSGSLILPTDSPICILITSDLCLAFGGVNISEDCVCSRNCSRAGPAPVSS